MSSEQDECRLLSLARQSLIHDVRRQKGMEEPRICTETGLRQLEQKQVNTTHERRSL